MRVMWIAAIVLLAIVLVAWSTTCTGPRPRPTGETIPAAEAPAANPVPTGAP